MSWYYLMHYLVVGVGPWAEGQRTHLKVPRKVPHVESTGRTKGLGEIPVCSAVPIYYDAVITIDKCDELLEATRTRQNIVLKTVDVIFLNTRVI